VRTSGLVALALGGLLVLGACSGVEQPDPAPTPDAAAPELGGVAWTWRDAGLDTVAGVSVGEDAVVALGTRDGGAALAATGRDGELRWDHDDAWFAREGGARLGAGPAVVGGRAVAVALDDGTVLGLGADDGALAWSWEAGSRRTTVLGGADDVVVVREDDGPSCAAGGTRVVALDLAGGSALWSRTVPCNLRLDGERVLAGDEVLDPRTGESLLEVPGEVCAATDDVALWMEECPGVQQSVEGTPTLAALDGSDDGTPLPTFPAGRIFEVRGGLGVLAAVYEPGGGETSIVTRSWVPGATSTSRSEDRPEGALLASGGAAFTILVDGGLLSVRDLDGAEVARLELPEDATSPGTAVQVAGTGPDYVLLAPSSPGSGQVLVTVTTS
jgi:outer membrane protein assembly factor BamB